jgi:murein L,D-transpeptidase YafK
MGLGKIIRLAVFSLGVAVSPVPAFCSDVPLTPAPTLADKVVVLKSERKLMLMKGDQVLKTYTVSLGSKPIGTKIEQGDHKTPEGTYVLDRHNAHSQYHKAIHISYPSPEDVARAERFGVSAGGELYIHGLPNSYKGPGKDLGDWTEGCIAVTNAEIDEIWRMVADGTPIEIKP